MIEKANNNTEIKHSGNAANISANTIYFREAPNYKLREGHMFRVGTLLIKVFDDHTS